VPAVTAVGTNKVALLNCNGIDMANAMRNAQCFGGFGFGHAAPFWFKCSLIPAIFSSVYPRKRATCAKLTSNANGSSFAATPVQIS
jgi:hypothetical protein